MKIEQLELIVPNVPSYWQIALVEAMPKYGITTVKREAAFLGQVRHESMELTRFSENLNYSNPDRIARIFRSPFDLDHDKILDPEEIEFAKGYVNNPRKLANRAYANRMGNGDETSGDGWKYRGRCPIQITFKDNYLLFGNLTGHDLVLDPDEALLPKTGAAVAACFFQFKGCNEFADAGDLVGVRRRINPGLAGLSETIALTNHSLKILEESR